MAGRRSVVLPADANAERHDPRALHGGGDPVSARAFPQGGGGQDGAVSAVGEGVDAEVPKTLCEGALGEAGAFPGRSERGVHDDSASGVVVTLCGVFVEQTGDREVIKDCSMKSERSVME